MGDFNDLFSQSEKRGRWPHPEWLLHGFRKIVQECELVDLGYVGPQYTWERLRGEEGWVEERLDRAMANDKWITIFGHVRVWNLPATSSDHLPIFMEIMRYVPKPKGSLFRVENAWLREEGYERIVRESWGESYGRSLGQRLRVCGEKLRSWGKRFLRGLEDRIMEEKRLIGRLRGTRDRSTFKLLEATEIRLQTLLHQRESYWKQRGKAFWLVNGDNNTRAFHQAASARRRRNQVI